jgi:hypothetical protein
MVVINPNRNKKHCGPKQEDKCDDMFGKTIN